MNDELIYRAAVRVAYNTRDPQLKTDLLQVLKEATALPSESQKTARFEEGKEVDVGAWLRRHGYDAAAKKWDEHYGEMGKKATSAVVSEIRNLAWHSILDFSHSNPQSKTASGSTASRVQLADRMAKKWLHDAIQHPGRVHEYLGVPEGEEIPMGKLDAAIEKVKGTGNKSLLSALLLAKRLKTEFAKKAEFEDGREAWLTPGHFHQAALEFFGSERMGKKWIQDAIQRPGRVHEYLGVPEDKKIPMSKLDAAIEKVKGTGNKSLLSALLLAKRLKKGIGSHG